MSRLRAFHPQHEPPIVTRRKLIETGIMSMLGVIVVGGLFFLMYSSDLRQRKVNQRAERVFKEMRTLRFHLLAYHADHGVFPPADNGGVPEWFVGFMKDEMGGAPLHGEQAKYARLDVFADPKPYAEPLSYWPGTEGFLLISRGPDLDLDFRFEGAVANNDDLTSAITAFTYDPTNGAESDGDIIVPVLDD